ncbi:hypothetical protein L1987_85706 [Smallanthus sonchifolius]|uniref:Uncharacterized protein n=1 Tax=Smallanthus sonchifolius TaxID=185202 RepID=A0ACB8XXB5_9ASTR|nr:hypothetical protein L1987_85706 [Smallanthus sonchifolius]
MCSRRPREEKWQEVESRRSYGDGEGNRRNKNGDSRDDRSNRKWRKPDPWVYKPIAFPVGSSVGGGRSFRDALINDPSPSPVEKVVVVPNSTFAFAGLVGRALADPSAEVAGEGSVRPEEDYRGICNIRDPGLEQEISDTIEIGSLIDVDLRNRKEEVRNLILGEGFNSSAQ